MWKEGRDSILFSRKRVLAIGVCDERGRWRRYFEHVGERKQKWMDKHEPQLGCFISSICNSCWPSSFFQDYFIHHQRNYNCMECCSFKLERRTHIFHHCELSLSNSSLCLLQVNFLHTSYSSRCTYRYRCKENCHFLL